MDTQSSIKKTEREIPLGSVRLIVNQANIPVDDIHPNPEQPRYGPKDDPELMRSIQENGGIFIPLLVEPHPDYKDKYQIIDGDYYIEVDAMTVFSASHDDQGHINIDMYIN